MTDLRALLGDRYEAAIYKAMAAPKLVASRQYTIRDRVADTLAAVLPDLLADAWDEGYHAGHEDARAVQPTYPDPTPNPYRQEQ